MIVLAAGARDAVPGLWAVAQVVERHDGEPGTLPEPSEYVPAGVGLDTLKDHPTAAAYRTLSWRVGIDPTKNRPAGEALARRVLAGKGLPEILPLVDAYNLASASTLVPLGAYDLDHVELPITLRLAREGETFHGIMREPEPLQAGRVVYVDATQTVCGVFLWRDAQATRVRADSMRVLLMAVGGAPLDRAVGEAAIVLAARHARAAGYLARGEPFVTAV